MTSYCSTSGPAATASAASSENGPAKTDRRQSTLRSVSGSRSKLQSIAARKRLVPRHDRSTATGQQPEAVVKAFGDLLRRRGP